MPSSLDVVIKKMKDASASFDTKPRSSGIFDRVLDIINNASRYKQYNNNVSDTLRARLQDDSQGKYVSPIQRESAPTKNRFSLRNIGSKTLDVIDYTSRLGTGAVASAFGDLRYNEKTGGLERQFSLGSVGGELGRVATMNTGLLGTERTDEKYKRESELRKKVGIPASGNPFTELSREGKRWDESNLPTWAKVGGDILFDPTMYTPVGSVGKAGQLAQRSKYLSPAAKLLLGGEKVGATSRTARIAGGLVEGAPKLALPIAAGAGAASEVASRTSNPYDDVIFGLAAPVLTGHIAAVGGKALTKRSGGQLADSARAVLSAANTNNVKNIDKQISELTTKLDKLNESSPEFEPMIDRLVQLQEKKRSIGSQFKAPEGNVNPDMAEEIKYSSKGKQAIINDIDQRVVDGRLPEDVGAVGRAFVSALPEKYLDNLHLSTDAARQGGIGNNVLGEYVINDRVIRLTESVIKWSKEQDLAGKSTADDSLAATKVIPHEVAHHLMGFVPEKDMEELYKIYKSEQQRILYDRLNQVPGAFEEGKQYRFENFSEFFTELISDSAYRDFLDTNIPKGVELDGSAIYRAYQHVVIIAKAMIDTLIKQKQYDAATKIYNNLMSGNYGTKDFEKLQKKYYTTGSKYRDVRPGSGSPASMIGEIAPEPRRKTAKELKAEAEANGGKIKYPTGAVQAARSLEDAIKAQTEPRPPTLTPRVEDGFIRPADVKGVGELPNRSPHTPPAQPNVTSMADMPGRMNQPVPQGRSPYPTTGLHIPPGPDGGVERPLRDILEGLIWGRDAATANLAADEAARQATMANRTGFERPSAPNIGDYTIRAEEQLNHLSDEALNEMVSERDAPDIIRALVAGQDIENIIRDRSLVNQQNSFAKPNVDMAGTRPLSAGGEQGSLGNVATDNVTKYSDPNAAQSPPPPNLGEGAGRGVTPPVEPPVAPQGPSGLTPPTQAPDLVRSSPLIQEGRLNVPPVLTKTDKVFNVIKGLLGQDDKKENALSTPITRVAFDMKGDANSVASQLGIRWGALIKGVFKFDDNGRIKSLPGMPTIQDLAARLPVYLDKLTPQQTIVMRQLRQDVETMTFQMRSVGIDPGTRADIMDGGFYLHRGGAHPDGAVSHSKVKSGKRALAGGVTSAERPASFDSMSEGMDKGWTYDPFEKATYDWAVAEGNKIIDTKVADYMKGLVGTDGLPLGRGSVDRTIEQNILLSTQRAEQLGRAKELRGKIDEARKAGDKELVKKLTDQRKAVQDKIIAGTPAWREARKAANATPQGESRVGIAKINDLTFPSEVSAPLTKRYEVKGKQNAAAATVIAINRLARGVMSTADNSFAGLTGMLGLGQNPAGYKKAMIASFKSWGDAESAGKAMMNADKRAMETGGLTTQEWASAGKHFGGLDTEFSTGTGLASHLHSIGLRPGFKQANRAFGTGFDILGREWADAELTSEMAKTGKTAQELLSDGTAKRIGAAIDRQTGYAKNRFAGDWGDFLLFAPRFLQARLETLTLGTVGTLKGGLFPSGTAIPIEQRLAANALQKFVGLSVLATVGINEALGNDTDFQPLDSDGQWNPNFMRIRFHGKDYSLLGTYDSLARLTVATGKAISETPNDTPSQSFGKFWTAFEGQASPVRSLINDMAKGRDYDGSPTSDTPWHVIRRIGASFVPLSGGTQFEPLAGAVNDIRSGDISGVAGNAAEWAGANLGIKSSPLTKTEKTDNHVISLGFKDENGLPIENFKGLNKEQRDKFYEVYPVKKGEFSDNVTKMFDAIQGIDKRYINDINLKQQAVSTGLMSKEQFREWYTDRKQERIHELNQTQEDFSLLPADRTGFEGSVVDYLNSKNMNPSDKAVADYYNLSKKFENADGSFDFDGLAAAREKFVANLPQNIAEYVERNTEKKEAPGGLPQEIENSKKITKGYFEADKEVFSFAKEKSPFLSMFSTPAALDKFITDSATEMGVTPAAMRGLLEDSFEDFSKYNDLLTEYKRVLRLADPSMDKALTDFYGIEPANRIGYTLSSKYGSDVGYSLNPAIAAAKGLNSRKQATLTALDFQSKGLTTAPRKFYRPAELTTKQ